MTKRLVLTCAAMLIGVQAHAQQLVPVQIPMSDVDCSGLQSYQLAVPPCNVSGTRTVTTVSETITGNTRSGEYRVDFDGQLQLYGVPVTTAPGSPFEIPAQALFGASTAEVDLSTSYTGQLINSPSAVGAPAMFQRYSNITSNIRSIDVDIVGSTAYDPISGLDYSFSLGSVDPTAIVNGSTVLEGRYGSTTDGIVFGRLGGTATLVTNPGRTPAGPAFNGGYISPFALRYNVTAEETTRLDEEGLVTPRIAVSDGIDMNGSTVSNLAAGVAPGDAVNKSQLDAEAQARAAADVQLAGAVATEAQTRAQAVLQVNQRIDNESAARTALATSLLNETNARLAADTALSTRLDAMGGRLDAIDGRLDRLEGRVASAAAVATALSGNAFLPDMKFNLTANVATYDGAHAGSLQLGAMVSSHLAVNAGVASGFNRRGKTAARAGVTIGW